MVRERTISWTPRLVAVVVLVFAATSCEPLDAMREALDAISPNRFVDPDAVDPIEDRPPRSSLRTIDGTNNHPKHYTLGAAGTVLLRMLPDDYGDGISSMAGSTRPSARAVSNALCAELQPSANALGASDFLWQWGQFLDHDIDLTQPAAPPEPAPIHVPMGDPFFDPGGTGQETIDFNRSIHHPGTGIDTNYPRQQINQITHFIDASNVYGSDDVRAAALRANDGSGLLLVSHGDLLPFNTQGLPNAGGTGPELFLAGDVRANEQVALAAMHTLFVREHNRLAQEIATHDPALSGEEIYQAARRIIGALMQVITYNEFLPALLGPNALEPYVRYDVFTSPAIGNIFSTAIFRFGHSALSPTLLRLDANGDPISEGHLPLRDAFFSPDRITNEGGIEPLLRGLASQACSSIDAQMVDDVRNFLFGPPGSGGFDLAALNIQRGRDHGLPSYSDARSYWGLSRPMSLGDIGSDPDVQARLASVYDTVEDVDIWVGALAEDPVNGGHVGELLFEVIKHQFENLRDGDYFWYERHLTPEEIAEVESTTLAHVIRRNTSIGAEIQDDVFHVN